MKSTKYLDQIMKEFNVKNDAELCVFMKWSHGAVNHYRKGRSVMNNEACLAVAMKLEIDPLKVIMAADMDRAEKTGQKSLWEVFSQRTATAAALAIVGSVTLFLTPTPSEAAPILKVNSGCFILCQIA